MKIKYFIIVAALAASVSVQAQSSGSSDDQNASASPSVADVAEKIKFVAPPEKFDEVKVESVVVEGRKVKYSMRIGDMTKQGSTYMHADFITDAYGTLCDIALQGFALSGFDLHRRAGIWTPSQVIGNHAISPDQWESFFRKVVPAPVFIRIPDQAISVEKDVGGVPITFEFLGRDGDTKNLVVRDLNSKKVRLLNESEFAVLPTDRRPFVLGMFEGLLYPIQKVSDGNSTLTMIEVATQ